MSEPIKAVALVSSAGVAVEVAITEDGLSGGEGKGWSIVRLIEAPRWVPVSERLPKRHRPVLCFRPEDARPLIVAMDDGDGWWLSVEVGSWLGRVTHWMPLPALPEEE